MSKGRNMRGYAAIGLDNPKTKANIGCAVRAAHCYQAAFVATSGERCTSPKVCTDPAKGYRHLPFLNVADLKDIIPYDCVPVAVDILPHATPLPEYQHPERAFYIFGAEDATLGSRVTDWCRDIVQVPTAYCMNLAATVNVVLYDRMMKAHENTTTTA